MSITDDRTSRLSLPLPAPTNTLKDDCPRIREAFSTLDAEIATLRNHFGAVARSIGCSLASGSFEEGAVITDTGQLVLDKSTQKIYQYTGTISVSLTVPAGTDPTVGSDWSDRSTLAPVVTYLDYSAFSASRANTDRISIGGAVFARDVSNDGGTVPAVISSKLYIFNAAGFAYKYIDNSWSIDASVIGGYVQTCIDYMTVRQSGFGGRVTYSSNITVSDYLNVKQNVELVGCGTNEIKTTHTAFSHHVCVYLKDFAAIRNIRISGSDYVRQSGGADYICYNKIGISTQGAATGKGIEIEKVGFSQITNSCALVFDGHHDVDISGCYTYGNMAGFYVETDASHLVTAWNAAPDSTKLTAGTQIYCLTNFYNSGLGTYDVNIHDNHVTNVADTFAAINGTGSYNHKIYGNTSIKTLDGYFGGYGLDFNGGRNNQAFGNTFEGHSFGAYYHASSTKNQAFGNTYKCPIGSVFAESAKSNKSYHNDVVLATFGDSTKQIKIGASCGSLSLSTAIRNFTDDDVTTVTEGIAALTGSVTAASAGTNGRVRLNIPSHGILRHAIVEVFGVNASSNGLWRAEYVDANNIELIGSVWSGSYSSGGTYYSSLCGVALGRDSSSAATTITTDSDIEGVATGIWSDSTLSSSVIGGSARFINVTTPKKGAGALANSLLETVGISGGGVAAKNFRGSVTAVAGTTQTSVTFASPEADANYLIFPASTPANNNPYPLSKSATGFVIGHDSAGFDRTLFWLLVR